MKQAPPFELASPSGQSLASLFGLVVLLPVVLTGGAMWAHGLGLQGQEGAVLAAIAVLALAVFGGLAAATTRRSLEVDERGLTVRSSFYTVSIEHADIRREDIAPVDCSPASAYALGMRNNGLSMPGFRSGWFKSRQAGKVFVVSTGSRCVVIQTTSGFSLLLGAADPAAAASALRSDLLRNCRSGSRRGAPEAASHWRDGI